MATTPTITIFVRYSKGCKYAGDEFAKRCDCRKWLRWTATGEPRQRRPANTRSWSEAEQVKRNIEDQLTGRAVVPDTPGIKNMRAAVEVFIADKKVESLSSDLIRKYERELGRMASFCEGRASIPLRESTVNSSPGFVRIGKTCTRRVSPGTNWQNVTSLS